MNSRLWRRGRLASLILAVVVVGALAVLPVTAYAAKATTRIVAVKSMTVNRNTPGVNPWPKALTVKLQKKISSTHYHALSGTVKLYRYDPQARAYKLVTSKKGSSLSFSLPGRGKYKLYYAGSSTTKAATAYTAVYETIGVSVSAPVITIEPILSTTQSWVNVKYDVSWNVEALDGSLVLTHEAYFSDVDDAGSWVYFEREYTAPGTAEFNYKVENADILDNLYTWRHSYVPDWFRGDYVKTPAEVEYDYVP